MDKHEDVVIDGERVQVKNGQRTAQTSDGRMWSLIWGETCPETFLRYAPIAEEPTTTTPSEIEGMVGTIALLAARVAKCPELDPRDRNAVIGQLRSIAGQLRGFVSLPGFVQAPFAPTTPRIGDRPEPR